MCSENIESNFIYKRIDNIDSDNNKNDFEIRDENVIEYVSYGYGVTEESVVVEENGYGYGYGIVEDEIPSENSIVENVNTNISNVIQYQSSSIVAKPIYSKSIIISEIYPNPKDNEDEFIEIKKHRKCYRRFE